jgi:hypothetical protein
LIGECRRLANEFREPETGKRHRVERRRELSVGPHGLAAVDLGTPLRELASKDWVEENVSIDEGEFAVVEVELLPDTVVAMNERERSDEKGSEQDSTNESCPKP